MRSIAHHHILTKLFIILVLAGVMTVPAAAQYVINQGSIYLNDTRTGFIGFGQQHQYNLYIPTAQQVVIELFRTDSSSLDPFLVLQDGYGGQIATDDDSAGNLNSRITRFLTPGNYRIIARDLGNDSSGAYRLSVRGTPPPPLDRPITIGQTQTGYISGGQGHVYSLYVPFGQQVTIEMFRTDSSMLDPYLVLQNSSGMQIASNDDGAGYPNARIIQFLNPGSYRILAQDLGNNDSGNYRLTVLGGPVPPPMQSITIGQTVTGYISVGQKQTYTLQVPFGQQVTIELFRTDSSGLDPYLILQDNFGGQIATDDDSAGNLNSRLTRFLAPGTYRIVAQDLGNNDSGAFRLTVIGGDPGGGGGGTQSITIGQTVYGSINAGQQRVYTFYVPFGQTITIEMFRTDSSSLDCYIVLQDASGMQIATDDDGAGYPNSRLIRYLAPGMYRVVAQDLGNNDSGNFRLTVR